MKNFNKIISVIILLIFSCLFNFAFADTSSNSTSPSPTPNPQCPSVFETINCYFNSDPTHLLYQTNPWSILYYYGRTSTKVLGDTLLGQFQSAGEYLDSVEFAYSVSKCNNFLQYLPTPLIVQFAGNLVYRNGPEDDNAAIYEFDPCIELRWTYFPWNPWLETTFGFAEGVSYATRVPGIEVHSATDDPDLVDNDGHFLNYLMFETTFALPKYPQWQFVVRVHHRSGCYGLYGVSNAGSNVLGIGVRYLF